eukprot:363815-Chlamydomonas_euryale.AAC.8
MGGHATGSAGESATGSAGESATGSCGKASNRILWVGMQQGSQAVTSNTHETLPAVSSQQTFGQVT